MESESWNQEDREFAGARQFVRVGADTVRNTIAAGPHVEPMAAAQVCNRRGGADAGARVDARRASARDGIACRGGQRGRWRRHGNTIVMYGV